MTRKIDKDSIKAILATDCGSTTTKAILIEKKGDEYRLTIRGEAPTTVEAPAEDVTRGVMNAVTEVSELVGRPLIENDEIIKTFNQNGKGVDVYISTSSAGGGLQMMVAGVVKAMTAESAERAALGAGAIVMDVIATNDKRRPHEKIEMIRHLRPDMILLAGGIDGGTTKHVVELADVISAADPKPRLGISYDLPVIYAGNNKAVEAIQKSLGEKTALEITENLRPVLERENLMPARLKIQDQFLEHVMAHAPGYPKLMALVDDDIMPTPGAVGYIMERIAKDKGIQVLGVDIGGATTDVFSVFQEIYNKTVSANLGMSYSISNVFAEAGVQNVMRWIPFDMDERDLRNRVKNKMIRPTTIPQLLEELVFEQAIAREALRLSLAQHKSLAVGLKGVQREKTVSDIFDQSETSDTLVNMRHLNMIIGSGGVLSHAPRRNQSMMMMIDAFAPEGVTQITVDSIFMMPQLGVLAKVHPEAATQVFEKDCLIYLGTCVAPVTAGKFGKPCIDYTIKMPNGTEIKDSQAFGEVKVIPLDVGKTAEIEITPVKGVDAGVGVNEILNDTLHGGVVGIVIDTRGRPIVVPDDKLTRIEYIQKWIKAFDAYPDFK